MKKMIFTILLATMLVAGFLVAAPKAHAANTLQGVGQAITGGCDPSSGLQGGVNCASGASGFAKGDINANVKNIVNVLLMAVGIISVIMIIIGGIRYAISGGDENGVKNAKNTILYAVVGLVIAILAFAIINFVLRIFGV